MISIVCLRALAVQLRPMSCAICAASRSDAPGSDQRSGAAQMLKEASSARKSADYPGPKDTRRRPNTPRTRRAVSTATGGLYQRVDVVQAPPLEHNGSGSDTTAPSIIECLGYTSPASRDDHGGPRNAGAVRPQNSHLENPDLIYAVRISNWCVKRAARSTCACGAREDRRGHCRGSREAGCARRSRAGLRKRPATSPTMVVGVLPTSVPEADGQYEHMKHYLEGLNTQKISIRLPQFKLSSKAP